VCCLLLLCYVDSEGKKDAGLFFQQPGVVCVICLSVSRASVVDNL